MRCRSFSRRVGTPLAAISWRYSAWSGSSHRANCTFWTPPNAFPQRACLATRRAPAARSMLPALSKSSSPRVTASLTRFMSNFACASHQSMYSVAILATSSSPTPAPAAFGFCLPLGSRAGTPATSPALEFSLSQFSSSSNTRSCSLVSATSSSRPLNAASASNAQAR